MTQMTPIVESFTPITLEETIDRASLQRRVDTKYLTDHVAVANLLGELAGSFQVLQIQGLRAFRYRSEYLDSPGRDAYRAHLQGRRRRYKCRVRHYVDSGESQMEVKLTGSRGETTKLRAPYGADQSVGDCADFLATCVADAYGLRIDHRLRPVLSAGYQRITLVSRSSPERVTLDNGLGFLDLATQRGCSLSEAQWIVETKTARGQGLANAKLRDLHVRPVSLSKYILGVALTNPEVRVNDYAGLIRGLDTSAVVVEPSRHITAA